MTQSQMEPIDFMDTSPMVARVMAKFWRRVADRKDVLADPERRANALGYAREWDAYSLRAGGNP